MKGNVYWPWLNGRGRVYPCHASSIAVRLVANRCPNSHEHQCAAAQSYNWFAPPKLPPPVPELVEAGCHRFAGTTLQCCVTQVVRAPCCPPPNPPGPATPPCCRQLLNCSRSCFRISLEI